jgi:hypothetical protein
VAAALWVAGSANVGAGPVRFAEPMLEPGPLLLWDATWTLRSSVGYRDNPSFAHTFREPSPFESLGVEWLVIRPPTDGNLFYLFFSGEDRRYFHSPDVPLEETFITSAQFTHTAASGWVTGLGFQHFYADQVFDLSNDSNGFGTARARGHSLILTPSLRRESDGWSLEFDPTASLQYYGQPLDNYREFAPKLKLARAYGHKSSFELAIGESYRLYDTTRLLAVDGTALPGTSEQLTTRFVEAQWRQWWGAPHQWRTTLKAHAARSEDNGSGYFDHDKLAASAQVQYAAGHWLAEVTTRVSRYDYPVQTPDVATGGHRHREELAVEVRLEYRWNRHLKSIASAEWQRSLANTSYDDFSVKTIQTGLEWEF